MKKIVFLGAGAIAHAIHRTLTANCIVEMWDIIPEKVKKQKLLKEIIPQADILFLTIPSTNIPQALNTIKKLVKPKTVIIGISKGINPKQKLLTSQLIEQFTPNKYAILHGPMLATELLHDQGAAATIASSSKNVISQIKRIFNADKILLESSANPHATALAGVLKNIYAIAAGVASELGWKSNKLGWLLNQAVKESRIILKIHKYPEETIYNYCFLADLLATAYSDNSSNRTYGRSLVKNRVIDRLPEGWHSMQVLASQKPMIKKLPIIAALLQKNPKKIITAFDNLGREL